MLAVLVALLAVTGAALAGALAAPVPAPRVVVEDVRDDQFRAGRAVCTRLRAGSTPAVVRADLRTTGLSEVAAAQQVDWAISELCPQHQRTRVAA